MYLCFLVLSDQGSYRASEPVQDLYARFLRRCYNSARSFPSLKPAKKVNAIEPTSSAYTFAAASYLDKYNDTKQNSYRQMAIQQAEYSILINPYQNFSHLVECYAHFAALEDFLAKKSCENFLKYGHEGQVNLRRTAYDVIKRTSGNSQSR